VSAPVSVSADPVVGMPRRGWLSGWKTWLAVSLYLLGAVVLTVRLWSDPASRAVAGNPYDTDQFAWFMRYGASAVSHLRFPALVTPGMNAPQGIAMMWNPSILLPSVLLAPVTLLSGPQVSLTLMTTLGFAGSAAAMFWVLRRWGCGGYPAFAGGLVYGFSPALVHSAIGHYDLQFAVLPPLIADAALRLLTGRGRPLRCGGWLGLLCAAQLLIDEEVLFDTVLAVAVIAAVLAASRPRSIIGRVSDVGAGLLAGLCVAALAAGYPLWTQFFGPLRQTGSPFIPDFFKNDLGAFVKPSSLLVVHSASSAAFAAAFQGGPPEYLAYLGWPMLALLALAAVVFWPRLPVRVAAVVFGVLAACSLGGTLLLNGHDYGWLKLPWYWVQTLPVAGSVLANRFSILADGAAAALFAFGVDAAWRTFRDPVAGTGNDRGRGRLPSAPGRWAVGLIAVLAVLPLVPAPLPAASVPGVPAGWTAAYRALALPAGASVLIVPVPTATFTEPLRWQAATGVPSSLVGGYFIGPAGNGRAYVDGGMPPIAQYVNRLWLADAGSRGLDDAETGGIPENGPASSVRQFREQIAACHPAAVLAVTSGRSALGKYLISVLGRPSVQVGSVLGWRLPPRW
jgi:hypothetical protein